MSSTGSRVLETGTNQITSPFKAGQHTGIDIVKEKNQLDSIVAHSPGTVVMVQTGHVNNTSATGNASYGNMVKIKHPNGYYTLYAHLASVAVRVGELVKKGQVIGYMGNTGNSHGAHLHFEVRNTKDTCIDPTPYINADLPGLPTTPPEEIEMTKEEVRAMIQAEAKKITDKELTTHFAELAQKPVHDWAQEAWDAAVAAGILDGTMPRSPLTREQYALTLERLDLPDSPPGKKG